MFDFASTNCRSIYSVFVIFIFFSFVFCLILPTTVRGQQVPVLTLDAGGGVKAEVSDYYLTDTGFNGSEYTGTFCFTITNTTVRPPEYYLPVRINSVIPGSGFSGQTNTVNFLAVMDENAADIYNVHFSLHSYLPFLIEDINPGIYPTQSGSFCFSLSRPHPFYVEDLIPGVGVIFSDGLNDEITLHHINYGNYGGVRNSAVVTSTLLTTNQYCFSVENFGPARIKGIGFDFREDRGPFHLISLDFSHPERGFLNIPVNSPAGVFSTDQRRLRLPGDIDFESGPLPLIFDELDFAILTPGPIKNGHPAFRSSEISACVGGDFSGLTPPVEIFSLIRWENSWGTMTAQVGGAINGTVATNPR